MKPDGDRLSSDLVPPAPLARREMLFLAALFLVALGLRVCFVHRYQAWVSPTQNEHHVVAVNLLNGEGYTGGFDYAKRGPTTIPYPLYTFLLAGWYWLAGAVRQEAAIDAVWTGRTAQSTYYWLMMAQCVLSALVPALSYLIARRIFTRAESVVAAALVALDYFLAITPTYVSQPALHILLVSALMLAVFRFAETPTLGRAVAAGALFGLASLTKTAIAFFLLFSSVLLWRHLRVRRRLKLALVGAIWITSAVVILPWTIRNYIAFGRLIPISSTFGMHLWVGSNAHANGGVYHEDGRSVAEHAPPELLAELTDKAGRPNKLSHEVSDVFMKHAAAWIRANPGRFVILRFRSLFYTFFNQNYWMDPAKPVFIYNPLLKWLTVAMMACFLAGLFAAWPYNAGKWLPLLLVAGYAMLYALFHSDIDNRFRLPLDPYLLMFAATAPVALARLVVSKPSVREDKGT